MTVDERLVDFMKGWHIGVLYADNAERLHEHYKPTGTWTEDMERGYVAGCAERELTEGRQREWLERCPGCGGSGEGEFNRAGLIFDACSECHGTGKQK